MKIQRLVLSCMVGISMLACALIPVSPSWAQKPPPPANPQAPTLNPLSPSGIQRGQTLDLILTGTNLANPTGVSLGFPAKVTIPTEDKNGQDNAKVKVRLEVPAATPVGWYPFRFATTKGVSNLRLFCVDDLPQLVSTGANRTKATAQPLPLPAVVDGALAAEQADYFKITVKAGQRVRFDCLSRRLGSVSDAMMSIYEATSMREIAFDNDSPGCQTDPRISYTFKDAGDYLVEIKDVLNRGGAEFFYRLRIGDFPLANTPMPMAAKRGAKVKIGFAGPAVEDAAPVDVDVPTDPSLTVMWVSPKSAAGVHGWPVPLTISDHDEAVEQEPNNEPAKANRIAVPGGITGRFQQTDDTDYYIFSAKKGQKLAIEAHTLDFYSPTIVYMVLKNVKTGAEIAKSNPQAPSPGDQRIDYTSGEDTDYILEVTHLHFAGGPSESYRITIRPATNSFELTLPNERFDVAPNGAAAVLVQAVRKGYTGPIEITATGAPGLSGSVVFKAGQNAGILLVQAKGDLPMGPYQFSILGKATVDGAVVTQPAAAKASVVQALNGLVYPPMHLQNAVALAVKEKPPFNLAIKMDPPEGVPGTTAKVTITATREAGFVDEITLNPPTGLPATIPVPKIGAIAKDKTEITFPLDLNAKTPLGEYFVFFTAKVKHQGKEFGGSAPPLILVLGLPFDLQVEPAIASLKPGDKIKVKVTATRKGGYKGPIALDIRKLPPTVTASKVSIAADQNVAEVELTAAPTATPIDKADVDVAGTATALNNLLNASPVFTVRVQKK